MDQFWANTVERLTFAFQPILSCRDGRILAVEALLRGTPEAGFSNIQDVFALAWNDGKLVEVDAALREKSLRLFSLLPLSSEVKLFSNLDNRVFSLDQSPTALAQSVLNRVGLDARRLVLEVSERHPINVAASAVADLHLALDDFGTGHSGLETAWRLRPGFLKIDRLFIDGVDRDPTKQAFLESLVGLGRSLGAITVAEGVETEGEVHCCRQCGCDALQGFAVGRPAFNGEPFRGLWFDRQGLLFPVAAAKLGA